MASAFACAFTACLTSALPATARERPVSERRECKQRDLGLVDSGLVAQERDDALELRDREVPCRRAPRLEQRGVELEARAARASGTSSTSTRRRSCDVTHPAHEAGALEAVEQEGDCTGAEPGQLGESSRGHGAVLIEEVDATDVGRVQAEHLPQRLVEGVRGGQEGPKRSGQLLHAPLAFVQRPSSTLATKIFTC